MAVEEGDGAAEAFGVAVGQKCIEGLPWIAVPGFDDVCYLRNGETSAKRSSITAHTRRAKLIAERSVCSSP